MRSGNGRIIFGLPLVFALLAPGAARADEQLHNVILFVPDGLRAGIVDAQSAPAMDSLRHEGVSFANSHSLFPTFTMPNASAFATGHYLGDSGIFGNALFLGFPLGSAKRSRTPFIENDAVLDEIDDHFAGNALDEMALLKIARDAGLSTAAIGKVGPVLLFDHSERVSASTIIVDDATGTPDGIPLSPEVADALKAAGLAAATPSRGANNDSGTADRPGTLAANVDQQRYFADVATEVVLPLFRARNKPFVLVYWSRDPDGTQHNQGDSLDRLTPGINGPTSLAAIRNADDNLAALRAALADLGLADTTDVVVSADHGFSTISKQSNTSPAAKADYADVPHGYLPPGFLALDLGTALGLPVFDPDAGDALIGAGTHPKRGNGLLGSADKPAIVVAANGGSDLVYLPEGDAALAQSVIDALMAQDYTSGVFVDERLGRFKGTLPLRAINLAGSAVTPRPAMVVNFRSFDTACGHPTNCGALVSDTPLQQGQGMHGSFSRADTMNFMAASGPDFKRGFVDPAPVSNADIGRTIAHILRLNMPAKGKLVGRVIDEALPGGQTPQFAAKVERSEPAGNGLATALHYQFVAKTRYFDAAGFDGRTLGLSRAKAAAATAGAP